MAKQATNVNRIREVAKKRKKTDKIFQVAKKVNDFFLQDRHKNRFRPTPGAEFGAVLLELGVDFSTSVWEGVQCSG